MPLKEYNTACICIDKGIETEYPSLEAAAKATGLSVRTIKGRCINEGKTGKDKKVFKWIDSTTKRAFKAKQSRSKGNQWERDIVNDLKRIGYVNVCTARSESKRLDDAKVDVADPSNELPVYIQAKNLSTQPNYYKIEAECPLKDKPFIICWKKSFNDGTISPDPVVILPYSYFLNLIKK